jgi:hypothetical protein
MLYLTWSTTRGLDRDTTNVTLHTLRSFIVPDFNITEGRSKKAPELLIKQGLEIRRGGHRYPILHDIR